MPEFRLPDLGEGVHEGQIIRLHAREGDSVREDGPFMEVETDKAAVEIPAPFTGTIEKWHVEEGQVVNVGDVMVTYAPGSADTSAGGRPATSVAGSAKAQVGVVGASRGAGSHSPSLSGRGQGGGSRARAAIQSTHPPTPSVQERGRTPASPATRKLARTMGIDVDRINGSGPGGRVTRADVEGATRNSHSLSGRGQGGGSSGQVAERSTHPPTPSLKGSGSKEHRSEIPATVEPLSMARKTIARNMVQSWTTIPHVTDQDDADVTELDRLRRGYPSAANNNRKLSLLPFIVRAVAQALTRHPIFNAVFDEAQEAIVHHDAINIALGVHTERGLVAPVIRKADELSVIQLADAIDAIVAKARSATFSVNETRGGTYTISNAGAFGGSRYSTPLIAPGQCAVLAAGKARWMPWVVQEEAIGGAGVPPAFPSAELRVPVTRVNWLPPQIMPRLILPLSHSFDHRIADGGQEIAFLQDVIGQLENSARLMF